MRKTLERKLRKMFRKRKYWRLGFERNVYNLVDILPLDAYEDLEECLTDEEFFEFKGIFKRIGKERLLFAIFSSDVWIKRCCSYPKVFDALSDDQLKEILYNGDHMLDLFLEINVEREYRLMSLWDERMLNDFMCCAGGADYSTINSFLGWLCQKEQKATEPAEQKKIADIFQKIASISDLAIAILLENTQDYVTKRIFEQISQTDRDIFPIFCQKINKDVLYDVLAKSDFALLDYANSDLYSWLYANLLESKKVQFLDYLAKEKWDEIGLFDAKICARMFALDYEDSWKARFVKKVFYTRLEKDFNDFYEELSHEEKELMFEILLEPENEEGKEVVKAFLKEKHNLSLLESLLNEKYVTD